MPLRFILKQLLMPPGILFLLLLLAWCWRRSRPRLAISCFVLGLGGLWAMSLPVVTVHVARWMENQPPLALDQWSTLAQRADAIVILGAGRERGDPAWGGVDQSTGLALERVRFAARLAKASGLPVLTSGGLHYGTPPSEAWIMAQSLRDDFGVTARWQEEASRTTWENAQFSARMLKADGIQRVVVVTQAWHMPRAVWSFEHAGLTVVAGPVGFMGVDQDTPLGGWLPESRAFWRNAQLLNEAVGAVGYRLFYR
jgi:uncharacterized SAM-binding protein YcdF (DUF218 family)